MLLITLYPSVYCWSNTSFSAPTRSLRCYRGPKAPVRAEPEGYTTGLWPAGATRRASPCHRQWRSKPGCAEGLGTKCGRCTASPALLPPAVASWPRSLKRRWQLLHATQKFPIDSRSRTWFSYFWANICMGSANRLGSSIGTRVPVQKYV